MRRLKSHVTIRQQSDTALPGIAITVISGGRGEEDGARGRGGDSVSRQASGKAAAGNDLGRPYTCRALLQKREASVSPLLKQPYIKRAFPSRRKRQFPLRKSPTTVGFFCKRNACTQLIYSVQSHCPKLQASATPAPIPPPSQPQ